MISIDHFSQSHLFDTSDWSSIWDMTLTLKQALKTRRWSDYRPWIPTDEYQCRKAFRHFMHLLNRAVYGNAVRRYGKHFRVLPILERGYFSNRGQMEIDNSESVGISMLPLNRQLISKQIGSMALIHYCWSKVDWGYREILVRQNADRGWIYYMLKRRQKSVFDAWSDCIDWDSLHNTPNC